MLRKPVIVPVCWGSVPNCNDSAPLQYKDFYRSLGPGSPAGFGSLAEYSLGGVIAEPTVLLGPQNNAWVLTPCPGEVPAGELSIGIALRDHMPNGACPGAVPLPPPSETEDRIYMVHFNEADSAGLTSDSEPYCDEWCAYHSSASAPITSTCGGGPSMGVNYPFHFAVIPTPSECLTCRGLITSDFNAATRSASHELIETITDPSRTWDASSCSTNDKPTFVEDVCKSEIADGVCEDKDQDFVSPFDGKTYLIQKHWSNQACDCVVDLRGPIEVGPLFPASLPLVMLSYRAGDESLGFVASTDTINFSRERSAGCKQFRSSNGPALTTLGVAPAGNSVVLVSCSERGRTGRCESATPRESGS